MSTGIPGQGRVVEGSLNFGVHDRVTGDQVGYARVVTEAVLPRCPDYLTRLVSH